MKTLDRKKDLPAPTSEKDRRNFYIPEKLTPLAFTKIYGEFTEAQRTTPLESVVLSGIVVGA